MCIRKGRLKARAKDEERETVTGSQADGRGGKEGREDEMEEVPIAIDLQLEKRTGLEQD